MKPITEESASLPANTATAAAPQLLHPRWMLASGNFLFHFRNGLFPIVFLLIMLCLRPSRFPGGPLVDEITTTLGILTVLAGQFVRFFVIGYAYIRRGGKNRKIHADKLVIAGLYAHSRNPMYVGNLLIAYGFSLFFGSVWMFLFTVTFFTWVYLAITAAEEQFLLSKFGASYVEYMQKVNRFVPDFTGISQSLAGHAFRWRESVSKEHGTLFATLVGLTVVGMWKEICVEGWNTGLIKAENLSFLLIPWTLLYIFARFLKTTGRLKASAPAAAPSLTEAEV